MQYTLRSEQAMIRHIGPIVTTPLSTTPRHTVASSRLCVLELEGKATVALEGMDASDDTEAKPTPGPNADYEDEKGSKAAIL